MTKFLVWVPATGRNRSKIVPKLNWARVARRIMAEISADVRPTTVAVAKCVAILQNARPRTAVPTDEIMSAAAFWTRRLDQGRALDPPVRYISECLLMSHDTS